MSQFKRIKKDKTWIVSVRFTEEELAFIDKEAKRLKLNRSEYIRKMGLQA